MCLFLCKHYRCVFGHLCLKDNDTLFWGNMLYSNSKYLSGIIRSVQSRYVQPLVSHNQEVFIGHVHLLIQKIFVKHLLYTRH